MGGQQVPMHSQRVGQARDRWWAILSFLGTCIVVVFVFPAIMRLIARHYLNHAVVMPPAVRLLMAIGALVESFRIPIIIFAGIGLAVKLLSKPKSRS